MELDRQNIEKRDFPIGRRGYDPAAVDAHLRSLAVEVDELLRELDSRGGESLGSAAGAQVQSILEAAETTAAEIERQATDDARRTREEAAADAARTREDAVAKAQAHVQAVSQATAVLLARVQSMDGEVGSLVQSLRDGAGRLAADLGSIETNMGELYDAASAGGAGDGSRPVPTPAAAVEAAAPVRSSADASSPAAAGPPALSAPKPADSPVNGSTPVAEPTEASTRAAAAPAAAAPQSGGAAGDVDGARLIALNMALNGEPRDQADKYLAENFDLPDRAKLLDEVYAAIEG